MKKGRLLAIASAIVILAPALVCAQAARNTKEVTDDKRQIASDKQQLARDRAEVEQFVRLLREMDALRETRALDSYMRINLKIRAAMDRELNQARKKAGQAGRELNQSRREKRDERQEAGTTGLARDYYQLHDDRRDLLAAAARVDRMNAIIASSDALQAGVRDNNADAIAENRRLMGEFLELLQADLAATSVELMEDLGERREDRRERRTDRRN